MNIKPEQIPDEVVEAAVAAWLEHPDVGSVQSMYSGMAYALSAALPVLLEKVAWIYPMELKLLRNKNDNVVAACLDTAPPFGAVYLYTLPTQDTPNADQ